MGEVIAVWDITLRCWLMTPRWRYSANKLGMQTEAQENKAVHVVNHLVVVEVILLTFRYYAKFSGNF